jgi:uncharacterized protein (TIGR03084 family)
MAIGSAAGRFGEVVAGLTAGVGPAASVDEGAALMVERERGFSGAEILARWASGARRLLESLGGMDLSTRVQWVAGELSARTLAATRLAETWIHTGDIASALAVTPATTDRLRPIARLACMMAGPVAFRLVSPSGKPWDFLPDQAAITTIVGPAVDLCMVAARRVDPSATSLGGEGPDVDRVLSLVRTYA